MRRALLFGAAQAAVPDCGLGEAQTTAAGAKEKVECLLNGVVAEIEAQAPDGTACNPLTYSCATARILFGSDGVEAAQYCDSDTADPCRAEESSSDSRVKFTGCMAKPDKWEDRLLEDGEFQLFGTEAKEVQARKAQCDAQVASQAFLDYYAQLGSPQDRLGFLHYADLHTGLETAWPVMQSCEDYDPRFRPWFAAPLAVPRRVVLLLDTSSTMGMAGKLRPSLKAATKVLDTLSATDYASVVTFDAQARAYPCTASNPPPGCVEQGMLEMTQANRKALSTWLESEIGTQGTDVSFMAAFDAAESLLDAAPSACADAVILIADGAPSVGTTGSALLSGVTAQLGGAQVFAFTLGDDLLLHEYGERLACMTGGVHAKEEMSAEWGDLFPSNVASYYLGVAEGRTRAAGDQIAWVQQPNGEDLRAAEDAAAGSTVVEPGRPIGDGKALTSACRTAYRDGAPVGVACADLELVLAGGTTADSLADWATVVADMSSATRGACPTQSLSRNDQDAFRARLPYAASVCEAEDYTATLDVDDAKYAPKTPSPTPVRLSPTPRPTPPPTPRAGTPTATPDAGGDAAAEPEEEGIPIAPIAGVVVVALCVCGFIAYKQLSGGTVKRDAGAAAGAAAPGHASGPMIVIQKD